MAADSEPLLPGFDVKISDRLFFDIAVPPDAAAEALLITKRAAVSHRLWGKPIPSERLRVMLAYLGDYAGVPNDVVERAKVAAAEVKFRPIRLSFDTVGSISGRERNRPFVLKSVRFDAEPFKDLQRRLYEAMSRNGLVRHTRNLNPYVTLLYDNNLIPDSQIGRVEWVADTFRLTHSLLGEGRSETVGTWGADPTRSKPA